MLSFYLTLTDNEDEKSKIEIIYDMYKKRMWFVANQILNDSYKAEDAVHNAFIGIVKNISHIDEPESRASFAYVITAAKHSALNMLQKDQRENIIKLDDFKTVPDENALKNLHNIENKELVISVLKDMPETYRELLYLHYCCGLSEKEIAELTDCKYATVRKQISRGKQLFAELFAKEDESYEKI